MKASESLNRRVPESPESESNYDDVEEEACPEPEQPSRIPCNSSSMDSFDSGLDTRSLYWILALGLSLSDSPTPQV